jgi:hypothetical protein
MADWERLDHAARAAGEADLVEKRRAETVDRAAREAEIADDNVLADGQGREEIELLVNDPDSEPLRIARIADLDRMAVDRDARGVRRRGPGEYARERALAGAVFPDQRVDFAAPEIEAGAA